LTRALFAFQYIFFGTFVGLIAFGRRALRAFVNLRIGVAKFNSDTSDLFIHMLNGVDPRNSLDHCAFAVGNMADGADIYSGLP
jgi:hypothetical protein